MVEDVEELGPKPQVQLFCEPKLPLERHICLRGSEAAQHIAPEITLLARRCRSKRLFVENLPARVFRAKELQRHSWHDIWPWVESGCRSPDRCPPPLRGFLPVWRKLFGLGLQADSSTGETCSRRT